MISSEHSSAPDARQARAELPASAPLLDAGEFATDWLFPPSGTIRYYFDKWNEDGTLLEIHDTLRRKIREQQGRHPEPTAIIIDSQTVKTTEAGGERGFDGGKQVSGRKRHLTVDTEGNLLFVQVHAANVQNRDGAEQMLAETHDLCPSVTYGWAAQAYAGELGVNSTDAPSLGAATESGTTVRAKTQGCSTPIGGVAAGICIASMLAVPASLLHLPLV